MEGPEGRHICTSLFMTLGKCGLPWVRMPVFPSKTTVVWRYAGASQVLTWNSSRKSGKELAAKHLEMRGPLLLPGG